MVCAALALLLLPGSRPPAAAKPKSVSPGERLELIRRASVWREVDVAAMDLLLGPQEPGAYRLRQEVRCTYEEKDPARPLRGHTKKFRCLDKEGKRLKIKYDPAENTEVFGEVAGTRLFWALGFYAERMYSVRVVCENCPKDPFVSDAPPRAARTFEPATIQRDLKGDKVVAGEVEGWTFDELERVDPRKGGSSRAQVDALKLLAAFVNHGDNTPNQQKLLCPKGDHGCSRPILYVVDLGGAFGGKGFFTSFRNWSRKAKIWKDPTACVADFATNTEAFQDPRISEAGRRFLAELLAQLSDAQIRDLFAGARFDVLGGQEPPIPGKDGNPRKVTVEDWARVFRDKREQILTARCPA